MSMKMSLFCLFFFGFERLELAKEGFEVSEFSVDGSEANICYIADGFELFHDENTDLAGGNLTRERILQLGFDLRGDVFHLLHSDGAFVAGFYDARKQFASVEGFARIIFFDDDQRQAFHNLIGRKATFTGKTFSSATNAGALFSGAGINNFTFGKTANRTFHRLLPPWCNFSVLLCNYSISLGKSKSVNAIFFVFFAVFCCLFRKLMDDIAMFFAYN